MNKDGKIFGKINIIDAIAILLLVVALVGITIRFTSTASKGVTDETEFTYTVEIENVRIYTFNALEKKGIATDKQGNVIGEIIDVRYEPQTEQVVLKNGETRLAADPEKIVVYVTLTAEGKEAADAYFVGENTELSVGSSAKIFTKYANCTGKVVSIEKNQGK